MQTCALQLQRIAGLFLTEPTVRLYRVCAYCNSFEPSSRENTYLLFPLSGSPIASHHTLSPSGSPISPFTHGKESPLVQCLRCDSWHIQLLYGAQCAVHWLYAAMMGAWYATSLTSKPLELFIPADCQMGHRRQLRCFSSMAGKLLTVPQHRDTGTTRWQPLRGQDNCSAAVQMRTITSSCGSPVVCCNDGRLVGHIPHQQPPPHIPVLLHGAHL
jgi:hypothetical protein